MRLSCTVDDAAAVAARVRASVPSPADVAAEVAAIVADVRERGDTAVREYEQRFGGGGPAAEAAEELDPAVRAGLQTAIANVRAVAEAAPSRSLASSIAWRASSHSEALSADDEPSTPRPT